MLLNFLVSFRCLICVVSSFHSPTLPYIIGRRWRLLQVIFAVAEEGFLLYTPIDGFLVVHLHVLAKSDQLYDGFASLQMVLKFLRCGKSEKNGKIHKMEDSNLKNLTAHQRQVLQFLFVVNQAIPHLLLDLIHFELQIVAMLDELIDVEVLLILHVYQLRLELTDSFCQL